MEKVIKYKIQLLFLIRLFFGVVFIYSSIHKILDPVGFSNVLKAYVLIPNLFTNLIAIVFPWFEMICGVFFIFGIFKETISYIIGIVLILFIVLILVNLILGIDFSCGCFSNEVKTTTENLLTLFRDIFLLLIISLYFYLSKSK